MLPFTCLPIIMYNTLVVFKVFSPKAGLDSLNSEPSLEPTDY